MFKLVSLRWAWLVLCLVTAAQASAEPLVIAAANSTCVVLKQIGSQYVAEHGGEISYLCKSSGRLAKGLKGGSIVADVYISANKAWMDFLLEAEMIDTGTVIMPWGNVLVLAVRKDNPLQVQSREGLDSDKVDRILIGDPSTAPFGRYAKQALEATGLWDRVRSKVETRKHITLLAGVLAESGESTVGILFRTNLGSDLRSIYTLDEAWHEPIRYYMGVTAQTGKAAQARAFLAYLQGAGAKSAAEAGFRLLPR